MSERALRWADVSPLWQACFGLAFEGLREGSNPIGALVADAAERVVATGKSAVRAELSNVVVSHCEIAHAEVNALLALDNRVHGRERARAYTLYSTLEPCPVCFGAFYMSDVGRLVYAARDDFGGSTNLLGSTPYLGRKRRSVEGPVAGLEETAVFLCVYFDVKSGASADVINAAFAKRYPAAVERATRMAHRAALEEEANDEVAFDSIRAVLEAT